jgi:hypothetical protein
MSTRQAITFVVFSGAEPDRPIDEWRFTTFVPSLRAAYRERWVPTDERGKSYYLQQGYLHLFYQSGRGEDEEEVLALHCDPNESDDQPHVLYKRGPHIHVVAAPQPLPHSHFALNLSSLDTVLSSIDNLHRAFSGAVLMLQEQVLHVYRDRG